MFAEFTSNVIRNHLNALKMASGLMLEGEAVVDNDIEIVDENLYPKKSAEESTSFQSPDEPIVGYEGIKFRNFPVICEAFKDPTNSGDKVALVVSLPAGAPNVTIELSNNGMAATVKYYWPTTMYDMQELFSKMLAQRQITAHHPRILNVKNGLEKCLKRDDDVPDGAMVIDLPMRVQTGGESWSMSGVKRNDGTLILMAEFTGYVKDYNCKVRGVQFFE